MATILILQSLLFLNHVMEKLLSDYDVLNLLTKLQTNSKIDLKKLNKPNLAKFLP